MSIQSMYKGQSVKTIVLAVGSKEEALTYALHHANETRESLFGWDATESEQNKGIWTVNLYTN